MDQRELTCNEMVRKIEDAYNKHTYIMCENDCCSFTVETDELTIGADDNHINISNSEGFELNINRSFISSTSLSNVLDDEEISIDLGKSKIKFLICD
jgi:hypothetical protein